MGGARLGLLTEKMRNTLLKNREAHPSYIVVELLEPIQFLVSSNPPQHQQSDWKVAAGMDG